MDSFRFECKLTEWCKQNIKPCPFIDQAECGFYCGMNVNGEQIEEFKQELTANFKEMVKE